MSNFTRRDTLKILGTITFVSFLPLKLIGNTINIGCDVCKKAWLNLCDLSTKRYQFRYIEPIDSLPKVFIYGDSISIAYTEYIRASLENKACIFRIHENGSSSHEFIQKMETMRKSMFQPYLPQGWNFEWDIIHFNVGLHDLKYVINGKLDKQNGTQVSSLKTYENNFRTIINYLKTNYPKAKLIFATTTPVPEGEQGREVGDAKRYNKIALKVLKDYKDIVLNDLYEFSIPVLEEFAVRPGNVHYKPEGSRLQGIEVARVISDVIGVKPTICPSVGIIQERFNRYKGKI